MILFFLFKPHLPQLLPQAQTCSNWNAQAHTWGWLISLPWEYFLKPYSDFIKDIFKVHVWIFSIFQSSWWKGYVTIYGSSIRFLIRQPMRGVKKKKERKKQLQHQEPKFLFQGWISSFDITPWEACSVERDLVWQPGLLLAPRSCVWNSGVPSRKSCFRNAGNFCSENKNGTQEYCPQPDLHLCPKRLHFFKTMLRRHLNHLSSASCLPVTESHLTQERKYFHFINRKSITNRFCLEKNINEINNPNSDKVSAKICSSLSIWVSQPVFSSSEQLEAVAILGL